MWRMSTAGRGVAAVALSAGLVFAATGCGGGGGGDDSKDSGSSQTPKKSSGEQHATKQGGSDEPVAEVKNKDGIILSFTEVKRDSGGFVTVNGQMKNTGSQPFSNTADWGGVEEGLGGNSLAGATLVDKAGKKRYYVLRDTEKRCLCTSGINGIDAGKTISVYMQFPAPPSKVKNIQFSLPTFPPTNIPISD
jgi:hypothetical protein